MQYWHNTFHNDGITHELCALRTVLALRITARAGSTTLAIATSREFEADYLTLVPYQNSD